MPGLGAQSCFLCKAGVERQTLWACHSAFVSKFCLQIPFLSKRGGKVFPKLKGFVRIAKITRVTDSTSKSNKSCSYEQYFKTTKTTNKFVKLQLAELYKQFSLNICM